MAGDIYSYFYFHSCIASEFWSKENEHLRVDDEDVLHFIAVVFTGNGLSHDCLSRVFDDMRKKQLRTRRASLEPRSKITKQYIMHLVLE
jgi:hypothetical protein